METDDTKVVHSILSVLYSWNKLPFLWSLLFNILSKGFFTTSSKFYYVKICYFYEDMTSKGHQSMKDLEDQKTLKKKAAQRKV